MRAFPMFIKTTGRRVVIIGGGEQAAQKFRLLSKTDAEIWLCAIALNDELSRAVADGKAKQFAHVQVEAAVKDAAMVFIATGCCWADGLYHNIAKSVGALVNVVDRPSLCDMTTPSMVDRDPVVVAIGTEGTAPVLSRLIKTQIEGLLIPNMGRMAAFAGSKRPEVDQAFAGKQRAFWAWVFRKTPMALFTSGQDDAAKTAIQSAIHSKSIPESKANPAIDLIEAAAESQDLLTLRAVASLQEADAVFHESDMAESVLELPRRDAERIPVSDQDDDRALRITDMMAMAQKGERVAVLASPGSTLIQEIQAQAAGGSAVPVILHQSGKAF